MFAGKHGLITPRDLFKWANRGAVTYEDLAQNGFMILGERLRSQEECNVVQKTLQSTLNVKVSDLCIWQSLKCKLAICHAFKKQYDIAY